MTDDPAGWHEPRIGAVFATRRSAEAAVDALRGQGLADEHLGLAVHGGETHALEGDPDQEVEHGVVRGMAIGAPIGALAGMTVLAAVLAGGGVVGLGGILAVGAATGVTVGGFWGAYLGLKGSEKVLDEEWDWERRPLQPEEVLVVVGQHGNPHRVRGTLTRHGGRLVSKPPTPR